MILYARFCREHACLLKTILLRAQTVVPAARAPSPAPRTSINRFFALRAHTDGGVRVPGTETPFKRIKLLLLLP